jgi:Ca2+-binding RTX toxin-like protein
MGLPRLFARTFFSPLTTNRRNSRIKKKKSRRLELEYLEDRTVPSKIIINPVFGAETASQTDNEQAIQPRVFLVFWGSYWSGVGASQVAMVQAAASQVVTSTFPLITNQYGADGSNMTIAGTAFDNSDPSNNSFDPEDDVDDVVQNQIDNGPFPESDATGNDHSTIYVVITPPNFNSNAGPNASGNNAVESDTDICGLFCIDSDDIGLAWVSAGSNGGAPGTGNVPVGPTGSPDSFSLTFSHEVAELMSDWDQEGFEVNYPAGAPNRPDSVTSGQIGDFEGNSYSFRLANGVDVQPVWSRADNAWAVDLGGSQKFFLDATAGWTGNTSFNGKYALTIQGDQVGTDDVITVGTVASGPQTGGVQVTENGETVSFDPGQITSITIHAKTGTNTINLNPLPGGVTLTMDSVGGTIKLVAPNTPNTWNITGADSGTLNGFAFFNATSLTGGTSSDTFNFLPGGSISGNINGGGGADSLNYSGVGGLVTVNIHSGTATSIGGTFSNISNFVGSSSSADTIVGPDANWVINGFNSGSVNTSTFSSFENLTGSGLSDTFSFVPGGSITGNLDGGGGSNTLDYSGEFGPVSVNLETHTASDIGGTFINIGNVVGGFSFDTLTGPNAAATWSLTGADSGSVSGTTFSSFEILQGGSADDQFVFMPGGSISGSIDGGAGGNTLDYSPLAGPVTANFTTFTATNIGGTFANITNVIGSASPNDTLVGPDAAWTISGANSGDVNGIIFSSFENLTGSSAPDTFTFLPGGSISGNLDGGGGGDTLDCHNLTGPITVNLQTHTAPAIGGTFTNISNIVGSAGNDTLIGPDAGAVWNLTGSNAGSVNGTTFSSFENLTGGSGDDQFVFFPGGSVSGNIDGGGGNNTLDYHNLSTNVTIGLGTNTATGIGGTFSNINGFIGGSGNNTVVGPNTDSTWTITGHNTFMILGITFGNFQNITGGAGNDTFAFQTGGQLDGMIDGGGGINLLTYAAYTGDVIVDLLIHTATGVGGGIFNIQNVTGSNGNSLLVGDANPNVLMGGTGRNVEIGDGGSDTIIGGGKDNILIGDSTIWDANLTALKAIFAEWTRTDLSFEQRLSHLMNQGTNDGRLNGNYLLNKKTVFSDGSTDTLVGGGPTALDWFFVTLKQDMFFPHNPGDHITGL